MGFVERACCAAAMAVLAVILFAGCTAKPQPPMRDVAVAQAQPAPVSTSASVTQVSSHLSPARVPPGQPDVRVMSFNCRVSTLFDLHNTWGLRKALLLDTIRNFDPDLLGTQECLAAQSDYLREQLDGYQFVGAGRKDGKRRGEMCGVFFKADKFERLASGHFWLSQSPSKPGSKGWGAIFPRMVTWVKLRPRTGGGPDFCWFNTHFDAFSSRARLNSAKLLRLRIASIARGLPVLVTGDFNADAGSDPYETLVGSRGGSAAGMTDTFRAAHLREGDDTGTRHAFRGGRGGPRIDWILASGDFQTIDAGIDHTRAGLLYPSDHFPVTAVLRPTPVAPAVARVE